jgi:hypothetical protein
MQVASSAYQLEDGEEASSLGTVEEKNHDILLSSSHRACSKYSTAR